VQYEQIENYIRTDRPDIWGRLLPLHVFYKNVITRKTAENCDFLACYEEAEQVAMEVIDWVETLPDDLVSSFDLLSQSHEELKQSQRITGRVLTSRANRLRRNLRRVLGLPPERDSVQNAFDADKLTASQSFIVVPDRRHPDSGLSAHDLRQFRLRRTYAINLAIADGLHDVATTFLGYDGLFLTLTLPGEYRHCSYEQAKAEISRRWKSVRRKARDRDILLLGMTALELHEDETPHYHIQLYVSPEHRAWVESQILDAFPNEIDRRDDAIKDIREVAGTSRYLTKDHGKPATSLSFIGLTRDIRNRYASVYKGRRHANLSDDRIARVSRLMANRTASGVILFLLRGFCDERLNRISARHPDFTYVTRPMQKVLTAFIHAIHFREVKDFTTSSRRMTSMVSHRIREAFPSVRFAAVPTCLYRNQEGVRPCGLPCERLKARSQPPPKGDKSASRKKYIDATREKSTD